MATHTITGPATAASARLSRATLAIGALGIATSLFVVSRVFESWRIGPRPGTPTISLLGQRLSYPTANAGAIAVLALALIGLLVAVTALVAAGRELMSARELDARLRAAGAHAPVGSVAHRLAVVAAAEGRGAADTLVIEDPVPQAFCAGLLRPRVYITTAALAQLDDAALAAVLAHERQHARRRDPLRLVAGRVLARALFFLPWLQALTERQLTLAELAADESAAAGGGRHALARAMLAFGSGAIDPARVDRLLDVDDDAAGAWAFPAALCLAALTVTAVLAGVAALAARFASGTATLAVPFLSRQPCVIVLALLPAGAAFLGLRRVARMRAAWHTSSSPDAFLDPRSTG